MKLVHRWQMTHKNSPKLVITDRCNKGFNTMLICTLWIQSLSNGESRISCRERQPSLRGWGCSKNQWRIYNFGWPPVSPIFFIFMRFLGKTDWCPHLENPGSLLYLLCWPLPLPFGIGSPSWKPLDPLLEPIFFVNLKKLKSRTFWSVLEVPGALLNPPLLFFELYHHHCNIINYWWLARGTLTVYREEGIWAFVRKMRERDYGDTFTW